MNLRVRRVQEVFDILATTLWVVTAPKQEGRPARGLGIKIIFGSRVKIGAQLTQE